MIKAVNIYKNFGDTQVLKNINLHISKAEIVSIVGPSGAGKTSLLEILGSLSKPSSGSVFYNDVNISTLSDKDLSSFRNKHIGFVFQFHQLLPEFTALENVMIPALINNLSQDKAREKASELLDKLQLSHRKEHKPNQLSGGEQQRVAVARALINTPEIVFADEPSGNLDSERAEELHELFFKLRDDYQIAFAIVTHNDAFAHKADRKITIKDGFIL